MESSVELQPPFSYAVWPLVLAGCIAIAALLFFLILKFMKIYRAQKNNPKIVVKPALDINVVKNKYLSELAGIDRDFSMGKEDIRGAYQRMSQCIRQFVHAVTGIKVQNYTLQDIKRLNMPMLYSLVAEYYAPEFARKSEGDVRNSLDKTRSLIERWR